MKLKSLKSMATAAVYVNLPGEQLLQELFKLLVSFILFCYLNPFPGKQIYQEKLLRGYL